MEEAERVLRDGLDMPGADMYPLATLAYVLGLRGRTDEARAILTRLEEEARRGYVSPVAFGMAYLGLRDRDHVFEMLDRAYAERRGWLAYLTVNPALDQLHDDPRYHALVQRMGLAR